MMDPTIYKDWQIAQEAAQRLPDVEWFRERLGLLPEEIIPYGRTPKLDFMRIMDRLRDKPDGKYIEVTAITPTPLGEGKSTTSLGLIEGLGKLGKSVGGCLRQPSGGPTMNVKGTAAGGGNALLIPMTEFSLGLTGDINDISNAHNLGMAALNARMQHERNYDDEKLASIGLRRLDIDPERIEWNFVLDFCCQALRHMQIGLGPGKMDGYPMNTRANIAVSSELMAILAVARDLKDLRERIGRVVMAYDKQGNPVTAEDLEVAGAMTAWMRNTINPVAPLLLDLIENDKFLAKSTTTAKPPDVRFLTRIPKTYLASRPVQDAVISKAIALLADYFKLYERHVALPELAYPVARSLKAYAKKCRVSQWSAATKALATKLEKQIEAVIREREEISGSPMELKNVQVKK